MKALHYAMGNRSRRMTFGATILVLFLCVAYWITYDAFVVTILDVDDSAPLMHPSTFQRRGYYGGADHRRNISGVYGWRFIRYVPSDLEVRWAEDVVPFSREFDWTPLIERYRDDVLRVVEASRGFTTPHEPFEFSPRAIQKECWQYIEHNVDHYGEAIHGERSCLDHAGVEMDPKLFSRFLYEFVCLSEPCDPRTAPVAPAVGARHTSYIEPLFGILRHPLNFIAPDKKRRHMRVDKSYMIVDKWAMHNLGTRWKQKTKRSFFFDLGASTYLQGTGGASQNWFFALAECMCTPFTDSFLWEARDKRSSVIWNELPPKHHPHYHWYNYPLAPDRSSWRNPLNHILEKVDVDDVLTVKIDFDASEIEEQLIDLILKEGELSSRIDELFYEDHVVMAWMTKVWRVKPSWHRSAVDSLRTFRRLRESGIRTHSWV